MNDQELSLPDGLRRIADVIGVELTLRLVDEHGGVAQHYLPKRPREHHAWARTIGFEAYSALCAALGGERIDIPRAAFRHLKKTAILELLDSGLSLREISRRVRCTERYVHMVAHAAHRGSDSRQVKLFS